MNARRAGLGLVIVAFCLPLFVGLGKGDLQTDEAIYSFSVDRMLESGDWLAPKASPYEDAPFLEKPPLKFWIVALPIRLGLLPHNEFGLRFWDAVMGAIAFLYVYAIGCRLAGPVCGGVAVATLFVFGPLLFEHGLRGNNMEAPLLLCYCGGMYHYLRAVSQSFAAPSFKGGGKAWHVFAVVLYFVLGFMTKFVAALFLPLVLGAATLLIPSYRRSVLREWRAWLAAKVLGIALIVPWFAYAYHRFGSRLWEVMVKTHVYTRMTSFLEPQHVQPWWYYWVNLYRGFWFSDSAWLVLAGLLLLVVQTVRRRWPDGLLLLLWFALPMVVISFGTSKLIHYTYPFVPPLALGAGYVTALAVMLVPPWLSRQAKARGPLVIVAAGATAIVVATLLSGEMRVALGGLVIRNSAVLRPALVALFAAVLASGWRAAPRLAAPLLVLALLPVSAYAETLGRLNLDVAPIRTARDCLLGAESAAGTSPAGLYVDVPDYLMGHPVYYYLRQVRPWTRAQSVGPVRIARYLLDPSSPRPVLISGERYQEFLHGATDGVPVDYEKASAPIVTFADNWLLLPGRFGACRPPK
jgi:4-amino-4-deoxy-L-arabinose transferase-like glycosyltransferase